MDKDGKPLKFLVAVYGSEAFQHKECSLIIPGNPKQPAFHIADEIVFLGTVDCIRSKYKESQARLLKAVVGKGVVSKQDIGCLFVDNAMHIYWGSQVCWEDKSIRCVFHTDGNCFQSCCFPSLDYVEGKVGLTKVFTPYCQIGSSQLATHSFSLGIEVDTARDCLVVILVWNASQKSAKYSKIVIKDFGNEKTCDACIVKKDEQIIGINVFRNIKGRLLVRNSFNGSKEELDKMIRDGTIDDDKLCLDVNYFIFFSQKGSQPNK